MRCAIFCLAVLAAACGGLPSIPDAGQKGAGGGPAVPVLDLNDVSFLYPLPSAAGDEARLPALSSAGPRGTLLPRALFDQVPTVLQGPTADALYGAMRVVSVRVDPCFPAAPPPSTACLVQVRLVVQPLALEAGSWTTQDAALHLFYTLAPAELPALRQRVLDLRALAGAATVGQPLDVHPVMRAQGLAGEYAQAVGALVRAFCGDANLTRVAFMALTSTTGDRWTFGGLDRAQDTLTADAIPLLSTAKVQGFNELGTTGNRRGEMVPWPRNDKLSTLVSQSELQLADPRTVELALEAALVVENPGRSSPKTVDCVSCHVASRSRHNAEVFSSLDTRSFPERFADEAFDLARVDLVQDDPRALRAFGYLGRLSALSQRTINESAVVARALSAP